MPLSRREVVTLTIPQVRFIDRIVNVSVPMQSQVQKTSSLSAPNGSFAQKCWSSEVSLEECVHLRRVVRSRDHVPKLWLALHLEDRSQTSIETGARST